MEKEIAQYLAKYFSDAPEKITLWWLTDNPAFGTSPAHLYLLRPKKFEAWFKNVMDENSL